MAMPDLPVVAGEAVQSRATPRPGVIAVLLGVVLVAIAAQISVPIPGSVVPATLQGLAILIVGGVLGPQAGTLALLVYLAAGAAGLPVFSPHGVPGTARLLGPTGGYLMAFPVAAFITGSLARRGAIVRCLFACLLGMIVIHAGGIAWLSIQTGGLAAPIKATLPLVLVDLVKVVLAALVVSRLRGRPSFSR
jgi:biotin transport system substrate-specific component